MNHREIPLDERIIFALDIPSKKLAQEWARRLEGEVSFFKVGLELFSSAGPEIVEWLIGQNFKVMLDLKFFDVPETVKRAVANLKGTGISFLTVHGFKSVVQAALEADPDFELLAVTVLTSFSEEDKKDLGICEARTIEEVVLERAKGAVGLGCHGIVCSPRELVLLRKELGFDFKCVTPGIRPSFSSKVIQRDDQARTETPGVAISSGADHIVIGRPIRNADDPVGAARLIKQEILNYLKSSS